MGGVNLVLGATAIVVWSLAGGAAAWAAVQQNPGAMVTMAFGSLVGGGTSEGGGAIGFPVLTKVLEVRAEDARLFTFAIQSVGMGLASVSIVANRVPLEWQALRYGALPACLGGAASCLWVAPLVSGEQVRIAFTVILTSLGIALVTSHCGDVGRRRRLGVVGHWERVALVSTGLVGGVLSGAAGVGENTVMFLLLVLAFRVCETVATPTTVVLMTLVSWSAFATHALVIGDFHGTPRELWLAAVPVVAVGAPLGALICTRLNRTTIVAVLAVLILAELVSTMVIVPMSQHTRAIAAGALALTTLGCWRLTRWRRYEVPREEQWEPRARSETPEHALSGSQRQ